MFFIMYANNRGGKEYNIIIIIEIEGGGGIINFHNMLNMDIYKKEIN